MTATDSIGDMLTRIRNAGKAKRPDCTMVASRLKVAIAEVLKRTGYIEAWRVEGQKKKDLTIELKYRGKAAKRQMVIEGLKRVSRPSCRIYVGSHDIPRILGGLGIAIVSTPHGVMTGHEARQKNVGGELICHVW